MPLSQRTPYPRVSFDAWPEQDQRLFLEAQGDGDPLSGTTKTNRNARSWRSLRYSYSHWIGYLKVRRPDLLDLPPQQRVRSDTVEEYRHFLAATSNQMSISIELQRLYLVIKALAPGDWGWLWLASYRLFKSAEIPVRRTVDAITLYATGIALMRRARQQVADLGYVSEHAAITYRKGLEIALPVAVPERKRVWEGRRLGLNVKRFGPAWRIIVEEEDSKSKKWDAGRVPDRLWPWIDDYIERFRPALPGAQSHDGFWASRWGGL